ncbi:hypothetical protein NKH74_14875 [Mesorhizobium sp. M0933]|uniref:hypothetical protein n=1 Tax=Mesorhizobium sp. M0933 TaxID=2957030 RepID=UPI003334ACA1
MTIAIALQVHDGVVLASDSALTLTDATKSGAASILNVYNNGNKIFNLLKGVPIGAAFYGAGSIGTSSVPTLVKDLRRRFAGESPTTDKKWKLDAKRYTIEDVAKKAREFLFEEHFAPLKITATGTQFGLIVAGYSAGAQLSEVWTFEIRDGKCDVPRQVIPPGTASWYAGGEPDLVCRIANGVGTGAFQALVDGGMTAADAANHIATIQAACGTSLVEAPMPIQDAIDLAEFFVDTTATFTRFKRGAGTVGGPTESVAITKHEGFKWVRRKHYFDETLNPGAKR